MTTRPSTDDPVAWYRRRLTVPGHPLAITLPYAQPARAAQIVALYALIGEIAAVPGEVSDPDVARRKLQWWRQALDEQLPHPAVQAWLQSGAAGYLGAGDFQALIEAIASEISPPRFERFEALEQHCRELAGAGAALEARLINAGADPGPAESGALTAAAAAGYRIRIVRDLVLDARRERWMVPLQWQAEYQLNRQQVACAEHPRRIKALVRDTALQGVLDIDRALARIGPESAWRHRHLLLRLHLDRGLGRIIVRKPGRVLQQRVSGIGPLASLSVWRRARRLARARRAHRGAS